MSSNGKMSESTTEKGSQDANSPPIRKTATNKSSAPAKKKLPPFLDHFNARELKILFRCSVALWVAMLLIVIQPTLRNFGNASFFGCIVVVFLPPSGVVLMFMLGGATMIMGMALAWVWGVISMKAALATRPQAETLARQQLLGQEAVMRANSTAYPAASVLVYEGFMLDTRVTVTYFCMLGLFIYLMARLRIKSPKLALTAIFAWIVSDVFLTIGPLLPSFQGTIPQVLIKPAAAALAISLACSMLIFPESTSHLTLFGMHKLVSAMPGALDLTTSFLETYPDTMHVEQMQALRAGIIGGWAKLDPAMDFLSFDLSFGYWSAQDITTLREPTRRVMICTLSLLAFEVLQQRSLQRMKQMAPSETDNEEDIKAKDKRNVYGRHQVMQSLNLLDSLRQQDVGQSVQSSYQALSKASDPLIHVCKEAFETLAQSIHQNNSRRWFGKMSADDFAKMRREHVAVLEKLREEKVKFPTLANDALFASHEHLFDENGKFQDHSASRHKLVGMFFGFNFEDRLLLLASSLENALGQVIILEKERTKLRIWFPTGLRQFGAWAFGKSRAGALEAPTVSNNELSQADKEAMEEVQEIFKHRVNKPSRKRNMISGIILGFGHWLSNDEGIFALRVLIATIAAAVPAVIPSTAGFYYREKGLWALIMAQTGTASFSAEFNFAFVTRIFGTVAGGVLGMLGWYIGSGSGPGNPYGLAAVMAVYAVVLMWFRLYTPPALIQAVMIGGATVILVIGYSYLDTHLPSYGNPGWGYEVFWRRTVLVLVGFAISFIVTLLPWPSSLSRNIAKTLSGVLDSEADHYAALLSSWKDLDTHTKFVPAVEAVTIQLAETLSALGGPIASLRFEFSSSAFDSETCGKIKSIAEFINYSLAHLHIRAARLPPHLRRRFAISSGIMDHRAIGDVMVVMGIVAQSLKTGDPLPARLPTPLLKRCLEHGHGTDIEELTVEMLRQEEYRGFCVCMSAYLGFLSGVDELVLALKEALGEAYHVPDDLKFE